MNKKIVLFLIHIPVWMVAVFIAYFFSSDDVPVDHPNYVVSSTITFAFWFLASFYAFYSYLVPRYLEKGKYRLFALYTALFTLIVTPGIDLFLCQITGIGVINPLNPLLTEIIYPWLGCIIVTFSCGGLGALYRFAIDWFKNLHVKKDLENRNLQSELDTLKSKLNPHLLFNTLNNIDTLIQTSPKQASEVLSKLSDILRYVVYETEDEKVSLKMEIEVLHKYIDLEKIRLVNPDSITFIAEIEETTLIPPMIFFPFVENGFKHSNLNNKNHKLSISISDHNGLIKFECINNTIEKSQKSDYNGVGLVLARKRLELLFPNKHELIVQQKGNEFIVNLQINTI